MSPKKEWSECKCEDCYYYEPTFCHKYSMGTFGYKVCKSFMSQRRSKVTVIKPAKVRSRNK